MGGGTEVESLRGMMIKLCKFKSCPTHSDKINYLMAQNKWYTGKLYRFTIFRQFLKIKHPSFYNRWITVFKWQDRVSDSKVKNDI